MKTIAIVEVPEGGEGKWYIDGEIRYTENESLMKKFDVEMIPLKPLPDERTHNDLYEIIWDDDIYALGFNRCLHEITGETE